jgi:hypothetical protein
MFTGPEGHEDDPEYADCYEAFYVEWDFDPYMKSDGMFQLDVEDT